METKQAVSLSCISDPSQGRTERVRYFRTKRKFRFLDLRYLIAKFTFESERCTEEDFLCLFETLEWLEEHCQKGTSRFFKYRLFILSEKRNILIGARKILSGGSSWSIGWRVNRIISLPVLLSPHEYFGLKNQIYKEQEPSVFFRNVELRKFTIPYVGVGYKDKGSSRLVAYDGTPDWRELCSYEHSQYRSLEQILINSSSPPNIGVESRENDLRDVEVTFC